MQLSSATEGDLVEVDHKGRVFHARVKRIDGKRLIIEPLCSHHTWRTAMAKEVIGIWYASKATRARHTRPDGGGE